MSANRIDKVPPLVWVVNSDYTGELNARIGLAERLGYGYERIPLPNGESYATMLLRQYQSNTNESPLWLISGTGEETTAAIADLKAQFQERLFNIYLASILPDERHPRLSEYDLIASPQLRGPNIVTLTGVAHPLSQQRLTAAYQQQADFFNALPKPIIGLLVGGNTRYCEGFDDAHARRLAERVAKIAKTLGGCVVITNSRRTPPSVIPILQNGLSGQAHFFADWQGADSRFYPGLLAHADLFIVTGDSLSMCSEAAFTGKPVLVDVSVEATECYHREIVGGLIACGAVRLLSDSFEPWTYEPPDPTGLIVRHLQNRFLNN